MLFANITSNTYAKRLSRLTLACLVLVASIFLASIFTTDTTHAACNISQMSIESGADCAKGNGQPSDLVGDGGVFNRITSILLFVVGSLAVVMLIFGGIRYVVSGGDQNNVTAAKNTILYAVIGIVVALLAYAAVKFVTSSLLAGMN